MAAVWPFLTSSWESGASHEWGDISPTSSACGRQKDCRVKAGLDYIMKLPQTKPNQQCVLVAMRTAHQLPSPCIGGYRHLRQSEKGVRESASCRSPAYFTVVDTVSNSGIAYPGNRGASGVFVTFWLLTAKIHPRFFFCSVLPFPSISTSVPLFSQLEHFKTNSFFTAILLWSVKLAMWLFFPHHLHSEKLRYPHKVLLSIAAVTSERCIHSGTQELRFTELASRLGLS